MQITKRKNVRATEVVLAKLAGQILAGHTPRLGGVFQIDSAGFLLKLDDAGRQSWYDCC